MHGTMRGRSGGMPRVVALVLSLLAFYLRYPYKSTNTDANASGGTRGFVLCTANASTRTKYVYVCVCIYIYTCIYAFSQTLTQVPVQSMYVCMHVYIYVYIYIRVPPEANASVFVLCTGNASKMR